MRGGSYAPHFKDPADASLRFEPPASPRINQVNRRPTGDDATTARAVASQLGIGELEAGGLPERNSEVGGGGAGRAAASPWSATASPTADAAAADIGGARGGGAGFAFLYAAAGVSIAAGVLYPVFGILLPPTAGAAATALASVSVIANALWLAQRMEPFSAARHTNS